MNNKRVETVLTDQQPAPQEQEMVMSAAVQKDEKKGNLIKIVIVVVIAVIIVLIVIYIISRHRSKSGTDDEKYTKDQIDRYKNTVDKKILEYRSALAKKNEEISELRNKILSKSKPRKKEKVESDSESGSESESESESESDSESSHSQKAIFRRSRAPPRRQVKRTFALKEQEVEKTPEPAQEEKKETSAELTAILSDSGRVEEDAKSN